MTGNEGRVSPARASLLLLLALFVGSPQAWPLEAEVRPSGDKDEGYVVRLHSSGQSRGYLGIQILSLTPELLSHYGVSRDRGVLVARVVGDSPADLAGVKVGDVLVEVAGEPVASLWDLRRQLSSQEGEQTVVLHVYRDGEALDLEAQVVEREARLLYVKPHVAVGHLGGDHLVVGHHGMDEDLEWHAVADEVQAVLHDPQREWIGEDVERVVRTQLMILGQEPDDTRVIRLQEAEDLLRDRIQELERRLEELERKLQEE
jgi:membrane-associated protease RseP (regulator of RpoE activity)